MPRACWGCAGHTVAPRAAAVSSATPHPIYGLGGVYGSKPLANLRSPEGMSVCSLQSRTPLLHIAAHLVRCHGFFVHHMLPAGAHVCARENPVPHQAVASAQPESNSHALRTLIPSHHDMIESGTTFQVDCGAEKRHGGCGAMQSTQITPQMDGQKFQL